MDATSSRPVKRSQVWWALIGYFVVVAALAGLAGEALDGRGLQLQFAGTAEQFARVLGSDPVSGSDFILDWFVIAAFFFGGRWLSRRILWRDATFYARSRRITDISLAIAALCDIAENLFTMRAATSPAEWQVQAILVLAAVKWTALFVTFVRFALQAPYAHLTPPPPASSTDQAVVIRTDARVESMTEGWAIACSGGGIRSAAFSLGALQALGPRRVRGAKYLSAVSGGAYLASGMTQHAHLRGGTIDTPLPYSLPDAPELVRLRARSKYLFAEASEARVALTRAVLGTLVNLALLWLVLFVLLRPIGWFISSAGVHPELRANSPLVVDVELADISDGSFKVAPGVVSADDTATRSCEGDLRTFAVTLERPPELSVTTMRDIEDELVERDQLVALVSTPGVVEECGNTLTEIVPIRISPQPCKTDDPPPPANCDLGSAFKDPAELHLDISSGFALPAEATAAKVELGKRLDVGEKPTFTPRSGVRGRDDITIEGWVWGLFAACLLVAAFAIVFGRRATENSSDGTLKLSKFGMAAVAAGSAVLAVFVVIPSVLQAVPDWLEGSPFSSTSTTRSTAAVGVWGTVFILVKRLAKKTFTVESVAGRFKRLGLAAMKVAAFVVSVILAATCAYGILQSAAMNGPTGRFGGIGSSWWEPGWLFRQRDIHRWFAAIVVLGLAMFVPARLWSLHQLYRDRLARAFFPRADRSHIDPHPLVAPPNAEMPWPELLVCSAANFNDAAARDTIAAGRWAQSFVVGDKSTIGWPSADLRTEDYLKRLSIAAQRDLCPESIAAVTGAAFSPAMGKFGYGPIGGLFAILNLRLGLWLPNPLWVSANGGPGSFNVVAAWPSVIREVFGLYRKSNPHVYVTDGGHWENLGLVELLRRGCRQIYVISAAGDGSNSFATISEAIALAREQLGVEIEVELAPMRATIVDEAGAPAVTRQLLELKSKPPKVRPYAGEAFAVGWVNFPGSVTKGCILFLEANLTEGMPWDVHSYAESHPAFPDDSTADQFFDYGQFEAYRRLGQYQMEKAMSSTDWNQRLVHLGFPPEAGWTP